MNGPIVARARSVRPAWASTSERMRNAAPHGPGLSSCCASASHASSTNRSARSHRPARSSAIERCASRSARQRSSPRSRYHCSSTAKRARAASKSSIVQKQISGSGVFGASGPAFASSSRHCSKRSQRGPCPSPSSAQNRSKTIWASGPGSRSGLSTRIAASACSTARARIVRREADELRVDAGRELAVRGRRREGRLEVRPRRAAAADPRDLAEQVVRLPAQRRDRRLALGLAPASRAVSTSPAARRAAASPSRRRVSSSVRSPAVSRADAARRSAAA